MKNIHISPIHILSSFIVASALYFVLASPSSAATITPTPSDVAVEKGTILSVPITLFPDEKDYTVKMVLKFSTTTLVFKSFSFGDVWVPLSQPGYDEVHNTGTLIKTAGYPRGVNKRVYFGTALFDVISSGRAVLSIDSKSLVLDAKNRNVLIPAQLFDIRLLLDNSSVLRSEDIVSRVTFESFGRVPTPITLHFSITDKDGKVVWEEDAQTTVQTSAVYTKRLPVLNLPTGDYTLKLHTKYNTVVEDDFFMPLQIISEKDVFNWLPWFIGILIFLILLTLSIKLIRDKVKRDEERRGLGTPW